MKSGVQWLACFISCIALTGCASNDMMLKRQTETEAKVEHLIQSGKNETILMNDLASRVLTQEEKIKAGADQVRQLQETIREIRSSQDELKARVILLVQQTPPPKIEVVNLEPPHKTRDSGPPPDYVKAFGLYSVNNFAEAIAAFDAFLKNNPKSEFASNALYWIGECHYSISDLPKAKDAFLKVAESYPNSPKAPDALLKLGYTLTAMKDKEKALATYENLIKSYPGSPAAAKAREKLTAN